MKKLTTRLLAIILLLVGCQAASNRPIPTSNLSATPTFDVEKDNTLPVIPPPRSLFTMAYDPHREVTVLFGGRSEQAFFNDTWEYDGHTWQKIDTLHSPEAESPVTMAYEPNLRVMVMYIPLGDNSGETWEYDGHTWRYIEMKEMPQTHEESAMAYDKRKETLILFSGQNMTDTWQYIDHKWIALDIKNPTRERFVDVSMVYDSKRSVMILQPSIMDREPITLELADKDWYVTINRSESIQLPKNRIFVDIAYDSSRQRTVLFGGDGSQETWEYDGQSWQLMTPLNSPPDRAAHEMVYDQSRGVIVLFGGCRKGECFNDTWEYDGITWTQR